MDNAILLVVALWGGSIMAASIVDEQRAAEVAAMLPERPVGVGRPITDRKAWNALAKAPAFSGVVRRAEGYLTEPIPDQPDELYLDFSRTGNRTRWQRVAGQRRGQISRLALAECLENKGRFVPAFEAIVQALCAERTWVMPAHDRSLSNFHGKVIDIDLASSAMAWQLATAVYLLGDKLSEPTRQLIRDNVQRRVLAPYRDMFEGKRKANWWTRTTSNWNAVCLAGVTGAALAQIESRQERARYVVAAEVYSKNFLRGFPPDGYCTEGLGYWDYGFGNYVLLAETICQATSGKDDLFALEQVRAPAQFGARIEIINDVYPAFADCSPTARPAAWIMHFVSRRYKLGLRRWEDTELASSAGSLPQAMICSFPNSATATPPADQAAAGPGLRTWFDDAGILVVRPAEGSKCQLGAALKGGHNAEHHNHNDVGSYVVAVGDDAVLADPGGEVYTARTFSKRRYESKLLNSYGHPVPLVAGQLQRTGRDACAKVLRTEFTDAADTFVLDIKSAYNVPELKKLVRTFVYSRQRAGALTVTDEVEFASPQSFATAMITLGHHKPTGPGSMIVFGASEAAQVDVKATAEFEIQAETIDEDVGNRPQPTRLGINLKRPVTKAAVTVTVRPMDLGGGGQLLRNGGFEMEAWGWRIPNKGISSISTEHAATGQHSLKITDNTKKTGSSVSSARMKIDGQRAFELRGKIFHQSGRGVGLYVKYYSAAGKMLNKTDRRGWISALLSPGGAQGKWARFGQRFTAPEGATHLVLWIHSYNAGMVTAYLDDMEIVPAK